jgi:hypothetical protein
MKVVSDAAAAGAPAAPQNVAAVAGDAGADADGAGAGAGVGAGSEEEGVPGKEGAASPSGRAFAAGFCAVAGKLAEIWVVCRALAYSAGPTALANCALFCLASVPLALAVFGFVLGVPAATLRLVGSLAFRHVVEIGAAVAFWSNWALQGEYSKISFFNNQTPLIWVVVGFVACLAIASVFRAVLESAPRRLASVDPAAAGSATFSALAFLFKGAGFVLVFLFKSVAVVLGFLFKGAVSLVAALQRKDEPVVAAAAADDVEQAEEPRRADGGKHVQPRRSPRLAAKRAAAASAAASRS